MKTRKVALQGFLEGVDVLGVALQGLISKPKIKSYGKRVATLIPLQFRSFPRLRRY
jgi:hypothetical protein